MSGTPPLLPAMLRLLLGLPLILFSLLPAPHAAAAANDSAAQAKVHAWAQAPCIVYIPAPPYAPVQPVPASFIGLSHEPLTAAAPMLNSPVYRRLLSLLSSHQTGPLVVRWGGSRQDDLNSTLGEEHWRAMAEVHRQLGVKYAIGLNLIVRDPQLAVSQVTAALQALPPAAIRSFGIGNEPDLYMQLHGDAFPAGYWPEGWFQDMESYTEALQPLLTKHFNQTRLLSGPGVAWNYNWTFSQAQARRFASSPPLGRMASALTSHWYAGRATKPGTDVNTFLAEAKINVLLKLAGIWVTWAHEAGVPFRFEEFNTLCEGGLKGASDTLGAALFVIDAAFSLIKAGVNGMNWHGTACYPYSPVFFPSVCNRTEAARSANPNRGAGAGCPSPCGQADAPPVASAPFYGLLFTQMALQGLPDIVAFNQGTCGLVPNVKVHTLIAKGGAEMRIVMVKKSGDQPIPFNITIKGGIAGLYGSGRLTLLTGPAFNSTAQDMTLAGQQVSDQGELTGSRQVQRVAVRHTTHCWTKRRVEKCEEASHYTVQLPAAGAAMLVVPRLDYM